MKTPCCSAGQPVVPMQGASASCRGLPTPTSSRGTPHGRAGGGASRCRLSYGPELGSQHYPPFVDDPQRNFEALVQRLRGRSAMPTFEARLDGLLALSRAEEGGVAVEDLCSNLYEFDVPLEGGEHSSLARLADLWGVAGSTADELRRLAP